MEQKSVVVVDPDQHWARELEEALSRHKQFTVIPSVCDGLKAFDCIQSHQPEIIILELMLDGYDGLYLLDHIHKRMDHYTPLIYILSALPVQRLTLLHRAITGLWDRIYIAKKPQLSRCAIENVCSLSQLAFDSPHSVTFDIDKGIDAFLSKLDCRFHLKRSTAARTAMRILLLEEMDIKSMNALYSKTAALTGGSKSSIERNLRSYRIAVKEANTDFYRETLAQFNTNNADFYWSALRVLKQEIG